MGSFFSLHQAAEWEQVVNSMAEPTIWSHAAYTPLKRDRRILVERPTEEGKEPRAHYIFPHGLKQDDDVIAISEHADVSLLVCFDEKFGRLYSGILLTAPEHAPHVYMRSIEEVILRAPNVKDNPIMSPTATTACTSSPFSRKSLRRFEGSRSSPMLLKKSALGVSGRSLVETPTAKNLTSRRFAPEYMSMDDLVELVAMLKSDQPVPPFPEPPNHEAFVEPRTLGALAALQLAVLASAPVKEFPGMNDAIRQAGGILPLVDFLRSREKDRVQAAILALGYIAEDNAENARIMKDAKALPMLLKYMKTETEPQALRCAAAASLQNIAGAFEGSGVVSWLAPSRVTDLGDGVHRMTPGVHVGHPDLPRDAGYDGVLNWLQSIGLRHKAREFQKGRQMLANPNALHVQKMLTDPPKAQTEWRYMLLYNVKEGILVFFGHNRESCERVVRDVGVMYGITTHPPGRTSLVTGTTIASERCTHRRSTGMREGFDHNTKSATKIKEEAELRTKSVVMPLGKVNKGSACFKLSGVITAELRRRFAVRCDPDDQEEYTNCVMFCMRMILELKLTVRGYDIRRICEERPDLGPKAGHALEHAWEQLWNLTGANMHAGLYSLEDSHEKNDDKKVMKKTDSKWLEIYGPRKEERNVDPKLLYQTWYQIRQKSIAASSMRPGQLNELLHQ